MTKTQISEISKELGNITEGWFPTQDEINAETEDMDIKEIAYTLLYFGTDPFERLGLSKKDDEEYLDVVDYSMDLSDELPEEIDEPEEADGGPQKNDSSGDESNTANDDNAEAKAGDD